MKLFQMNESSVLGIGLQAMPRWAKNLILTLGSGILIGLCVQIAIPLPFTPIPLSTQPTLILLIGLLLGSKRAFTSVAVFLAQGAMGFPVFAGGAAGLAILMGPRAGYFIGYLAAAFVVGKLMEASAERSISRAFFSMVTGNIIIYLFGFLVLSFTLGARQAMTIGVLPFIVGDLVKIALSLKLLQCIGWTKK